LEEELVIQLVERPCRHDMLLSCGCRTAGGCLGPA
jgi:hypothetical protein